jgi:hypothetical protein
MWFITLGYTDRIDDGIGFESIIVSSIIHIFMLTLVINHSTVSWLAAIRLWYHKQTCSIRAKRHAKENAM